MIARVFRFQSTSELYNLKLCVYELSNGENSLCLVGSREEVHALSKHVYKARIEQITHMQQNRILPFSAVTQH